MLVSETTPADEKGKKVGKFRVRKGSEEKEYFAESRKNELKGLLQDGTLRPVKLSSLDGSPRIFESHFVDEIKKDGEALKKKGRLVAQNYAY